MSEQRCLQCGATTDGPYCGTPYCRKKLDQQCRVGESNPAHARGESNPLITTPVPGHQQSNSSAPLSAAERASIQETVNLGAGDGVSWDAEVADTMFRRYEATVVAAEQDTARLDFLQCSLARLTVMDSHSGDGTGWAIAYYADVMDAEHGVTSETGGGTLREAIDFAITPREADNAR